MSARVLPFIAGLVLLPLLLAFSTGPGPFRTGAFGDSGHCAAGSCHVGVATRGEGIHVYFPNGPYYHPGVPQRIVLRVTGASANPDRGVFGFQLSPRLSGPALSAGGQLATIDGRVWVQCGDGNQKPIGGCAASSVEFAQHRMPSSEPLWELEWTPPAASEPVEFHAAANAADGSGDNFGDRIYLRSFRVLRAGSLTFRQPFGGAGASPNAWLEIYGANLAPTGSAAATTVTVGGRLAHVSFAGPTQVNALLAADTPLGERMLELRSPSGRIDSPIIITEASPSIYPALPAVMAGDVAVLYATGCGRLAEPARADVRLGRRSLPATAYASPEFPGLCQFHFTPPEAAPSALPLRICLRGECSQPGLALHVAAH